MDPDRMISGFYADLMKQLGEGLDRKIMGGNMPSLYNITTDILELEGALDRSEDTESSDFLLEHLLTHQERLAEKIDNYVAYYRDLKGKAELQKAEAKHLREMAQANENRADRLKQAAQDAAKMLGKKKLEGNSRSITVSENSRPAIDITDEETVPEQFKEQVVSWKIDKGAIADWVMKSGEAVSGVSVRKVVTVRFR
jgi:hypothetical protein